MRTITDAMITGFIEEAARSERKRTIYRLHEHEEPIQRMVNALVPGTYITPHQHGNPPKVELMCVLKGRVALLQFAPDGQVEEVHILDENGPVKIVDIAPGVFHNMVALTPCAVLEIIKGPYDAATHKQFAPFAPAEGDTASGDYLRQLEAHIAAIM
ncbi:MAG: WbuC family cupin fold metalloprotein [bacterium]|nr:WbuC family cupin fold metalloprotein [bacterium]